jgi:endonuclease/exonuclease/phosphatase family metal-dependent hydrolase
MKKAFLTIILILSAGMMGFRAQGERTCEQLPLLVGDPPITPSPGDRDITIVSLNMYEETDVNTILTQILESEPLLRADIFLLQEVVQRNGTELSMAQKLARELNFHYAFAPAAPRREDTDRGIAILSRFELRDASMIPLKVYNLVFRSRCRVALAATVETPIGALRVVNVHLDNRLNSREKVAQLSPVLDAVEEHDGPRIVGGDFNTGNILWLSHVIPVPFAQKQLVAVRSAMTEQGFTTPFGSTPTFDHLGLKLDWIFMKELKVVESGVQPIRFSDHHAVWTRLARAGTSHQAAAGAP